MQNHALEQDGSKQKFLGGTMAKLWPDLCLGVTKTRKRNENERFKSAKKGNFSCKLQ